MLPERRAGSFGSTSSVDSLDEFLHDVRAPGARGQAGRAAVPAFLFQFLVAPVRPVGLRTRSWLISLR